ncbi:hypothetical protein QBC41DRAFT_393622 [Cercophora samala]|uniref:Uncharacterized protein n=1 Tax=Cercophora samala TaxID=330535 RepID=A0AA39ZD62_9PEZI|nr:hypothetical protein QBC41DRAFT_393622 [Cercophora samala]
MEALQSYLPFPALLSLALLALVAIFVSVLVTLITKQQHYQNLAVTTTTTPDQAQKSTTTRQPQNQNQNQSYHRQQQRATTFIQEPLQADEPAPAAAAARPIAIRQARPTTAIPQAISSSSSSDMAPVVAWRNSFGPNTSVHHPSKRASFASSAGARKGSCSRFSWSSSEGGDSNSSSGSGSEGSVGGREVYFGNMGAHLEG